MDGLIRSLFPRTRKGSSALKLAPILLALVGLVIAFLNRDMILGVPQPAPGPVAAGEYIFCFWNVENLFDDHDDARRQPDEDFDNWFSRNAGDRRMKINRLTTTMLKMNGGRGPDIVALVEVETKRAAELLRDDLNAALPDGVAKYGEVQFSEVKVGRNIAPAVFARLPIQAKQSRGFSPHRILQANLDLGGRELVVFASHWTSRMTDKGTDGKREGYADVIYSAASQLHRTNPAADILVCGDFNDEPTDPSLIRHLHASGDAAAVAWSRDSLQFLNLLAGKDPNQFGTLYYNKPVIYDHICVSPGLIDAHGWTCLTESASTFTTGLIRPGATRRQPWRFGDVNSTEPRGYSDHFPVTVTLRVQ